MDRDIEKHINNYITYKPPKMQAILFLLILIISQQLDAQDIHYSQYYNSDLNLNPALTAYTQASYRFSLNNRNQWSSVSIPFKSLSASMEAKAFHFQHNRSYLGLGILFNKDEAGDSKYGTTQLAISSSWIKSLNRKNSSLLSVGLQAAFYQRSIDYTKLYFPEQWNGTSSNINYGNSENFKVNQFNFFDVSMGIHWFWAPNNKLKFNTGFSAWHLNRPNQSLMEDKNALLYIKYQSYCNIRIKTTHVFDLLPSIFISKQGPYYEIIAGIRFYNKIHQQRKRYFALSTGLYLRSNDALILFLGMDYKTIKIGATYDINISSLSVASHYMGGMELSLQWQLFKGNHPKKITPTPCPIF